MWRKAHQIEIDADNLGYTDRIGRLVLGFVMIGAVLFGDLSPVGVWVLLPLAAVYPVLSAMLGWDPLYALFGLSSRKRPAEAGDDQMVGSQPYRPRDLRPVRASSSANSLRRRPRVGAGEDSRAA